LERLTPVEQRAPGRWEIATVSRIKQETPRVKSFWFDLPMWMPHLPGQHYDIRLTAPDGYRAQRSYSIASSPLDEGKVELTIDLLDDGEVSPYFHEVVEEGDQVELRGPFTSYFVWRGEAPVLLVGGGSGVVPLMSMVRHRAAAGGTAAAKLVYSSRTLDDVIYRSELDELAARRDGFEVVHTLTREQPEGWTGYARRIDPELLAEVAWPASEQPRVYVCGSTRFVDAAADGLLALGYDSQSIRTERFGATGS
jgi:ferredoxin-NADP reductase